LTTQPVQDKPAQPQRKRPAGDTPRARQGGGELLPWSSETLPSYRREADRRFRRRRRFTALLMAVLVALPTVAAAAYYYGVAADRYVSEATFVVRRLDSTPVAGDLIAQFASMGQGGAATEETAALERYFVSHAAVERLSERLDLRGIYGHPDADRLSRLPADASGEELRAFHRAMIDVEIDSSGVVTLGAQAFEPEAARAIAQALLELGEERVNAMSRKIHEDSIAFARREAEEAEQSVLDIQSRMTDFRLSERSLNPEAQSSAIGGLVAQLESKLADARAERNEALTYLQPDSQQVRGLEARIAALEAEIAREGARLTGESDGSMARLVEGYARLELQQELATQRLTMALGTLENAINEAQRQQTYVVAVTPAHRPDESLKPERLQNVAVVLLGSLLVYGIASLFIAAIRDHV